MASKQKTQSKLRLNVFVRNPCVKFIASLLFAAISFLPLAFGILNRNIESLPLILRIIILVIWGLALVAEIWTFLSERTIKKILYKLEKSEEFSKAAMVAQQRSNAAKVRAILQVTYGHVPEWHPFNFQENVLVYDVHEHLRTVLVDLRDSICATMKNQLGADAITVDLVYCYPNCDYDGTLPVSSKNSALWRVITSGDYSCANSKIHDYLEHKESFYALLDRDNYVFLNNKGDAPRNYENSGKDYEYGIDGSVVGLSLNVKNDMPEQVLVKALLTITTYGEKLCEDDSEIDINTYQELFKSVVLNGYKSMLESELAQMYIRHMIREGNMCPRTGMLSSPIRENPIKTITTKKCLLRNSCTEKRDCIFNTAIESANSQEEI